MYIYVVPIYQCKLIQIYINLTGIFSPVRNRFCHIFVQMSIHPSIYPSIYLSIYMYIYVVPIYQCKLIQIYINLTGIFSPVRNRFCHIFVRPTSFFILHTHDPSQRTSYLGVVIRVSPLAERTSYSHIRGLDNNYTEQTSENMILSKST